MPVNVPNLVKEIMEKSGGEFCLQKRLVTHFVLWFVQTEFSSFVHGSMPSNAPFTLLHFCTKTQIEFSVFVKPFTLLCTKTHRKRRLTKTPFKVDIYKNGGFFECGRSV